MTDKEEKYPIFVEIKVKESNKKPKNLKFKIMGTFNNNDRLNELDEIPKTPEGCTDNWLISKMLCEKDGGRLPSIGELAIISALQDAKLLNTKYYGNFWSASEVSPQRALVRGISGNYSLWNQYNRNHDYVPLCVGD